MLDHSHLNQRMDRYGYAVQIHGSCDGQPGWVYTIGNHLLNQPELIVSSIATPSVALMLLQIRTKMEQGLRLSVGLNTNLFNYPFRVIRATTWTKAHRTPKIAEFYGSDRYDLFQVILQDPEGRFPEDETCVAPYRDQEYLGSMLRLV